MRSRTLSTGIGLSSTAIHLVRVSRSRLHACCRVTQVARFHQCEPFSLFLFILIISPFSVCSFSALVVGAKTDPKQQTLDARQAVENLKVEDGSLEWFLVNVAKLGALVSKASSLGEDQRKSRMKMFLECLRYFPQTQALLDCPIVALGAMDDEVVPFRKLCEWGAWTTKLSMVLPVPGGGGHLFVLNKPDFVASVICRFIQMASESPSTDFSSSPFVSMLFS